MFQERFDQGAPRHFNGYRDAVNLSLCQLLHPVDKLNDAFAAVLDFSLGQHLPLRIHDASLVLLGGPIDAQIEMKLSCHDTSLSDANSLDRRSQRQPCTGAQRRKLPTGLSATGHPDEVLLQTRRWIRSSPVLYMALSPGRPSCLLA